MWISLTRDLGMTKNTDEKIMVFSELWIFVDSMKQILGGSGIER